MDKDTQEARERVRGFSFKEKVKHYWGYYKATIAVLMIFAFMIGYTVYQKATQENADFEISIFAKGEVEANVVDTLEMATAKWLTDEKNGENRTTNANLYVIPYENMGNMEAVQGVYTKLHAEFAAGQAPALIFDEEVYDENMSEDGFGYIALDEYSGEIGKNAKKVLGLDEGEKYYYITRTLDDKKADDEDAIKKQEYAKQIYLKIKELN